MHTPPSYFTAQLEEMIKRVKELNPTAKLYHHTKKSNLSSLLKSKSIYSIGTLWGLNPHSRTWQSKNCWDKTAKAGFIDYVFLSTINRLDRSNGQNTVYGHIAFEIDLDVLLEREYFVYPFNTGFEWDAPYTQSRKKSDVTTLQLALFKPKAADEILVRRKIDLKESVKLLHCFDSDKAWVEKELQSLEFNNIRVQPWPNQTVSGVPQMTAQRQAPDFDIKITDGRLLDMKLPETLKKTFLTIEDSDSKQQKTVYYFDEHTNCVLEFLVRNRKVYDASGEHELGMIHP